MCSFLESNSGSRTLWIENDEMVTYVTRLVLNILGFQVVLLMVRLPLKLLNMWSNRLTSTYQVLTLAKEHLKQKLGIVCKNCFMNVLSFMLDMLKMQKSMLRLGIRICWGIFWSIYVLFLLVGLLILGFVISGITMKHLVEKPIQTTETLYFDYTKASHVAFVSRNLVSKDMKSFPKHIGDRIIPDHHTLMISVSLTIPESDYNRNMGIFQVRVECLSADGMVTASFTQSSMLRYKSQSIKYIDTLFKSIPFLNGFRSEVQNLKVGGALDFSQGIESITCFKVTIEKRARYEPGFGIPEIYAGTMDVETQLPKFKGFIWNWRRTLFVGLSFSVFLMEVAISVIFCRPIILPGKALRL